MFPWDAVDFFYPYFHFVHEELRHFRLPLWDPYVMSGYPIIGDMEAQIFYPVNWLFVLLSPSSPLSYRLVEMQLIFHFFLAGLFMYFLAREFVSTPMPALLSGVLFMSSGAMVAHTQHLASINAMTWFPLVILLARRSLLNGSYFYAASAGMVYGIQILAGHWQHSAYLGLFLFLLFFYEAAFGQLRAQLWPRWILMLFLVAGLGAGLAMVQVIPSYELGIRSVRSSLTELAVTQGNEPHYLWTLILPNYFGGLRGVEKWYPYDLSFLYVFLTVPGCLLALLGLGEMVRRRNWFWLGAILLFVELSFGAYGHLAPLLARTPVLNLFRTMATFFDLANLGLCLMAAVGAERLFSGKLPEQWKSWLPAGLAAVLLSATISGLAWELPGKIAGWSHMLVVFALVTLIVTGMMRNWIQPGISRWAIFGLMVFDLCFYSMNQPISTVEENPRTYLSRNSALHYPDLIEFLRSDTEKDFRVAGIAEYPFSGNGWNVWRIPGIYGWNPLTLSRYQRYIQMFTQTSYYTFPEGGPDSKFDLPLLDLLGTKYLLIVDPVWKENPELEDSSRFEYAYRFGEWWRIYRNEDYLSRGWFYPRALVVPNDKLAQAVMTGSRFDPRRTVVLEAGDLGEEGTRLMEGLQTISLAPQDAAAASNGHALVDSYCPEHPMVFGDYWGSKGDWVRFDVQGPAQPGRYLLVLEYTAGQPPLPELRAEAAHGADRQDYEPVSLSGTPDWLCSNARTVELGEFELRPGINQITLYSEADSIVNLYSLWLVRLPPPPEPNRFSLDHFSASANQVSLDARVEEDGFLLLNEIYYPGWRATLDGKPVEILRADAIFRAVYVPAGSHRIEMRFQPRYFAWGASVSFLTLAAFLGCCVVQ